MAVLAFGRMVSFISICHSSYNVFHSDNLSKPSFSLCYIQHHSLCEHHHNETGFVNDLWLTYQQPTGEWSSLSLTCKRNTTCNLYCFQNNTQVSFSNAFPLFLRYNHPTKSTSFNRVSNTLMHWYHHHITYLQLNIHHCTVLFVPSTLTPCSRSIW